MGEIDYNVDLNKAQFQRKALFNKKNKLRQEAASSRDAQAFYSLCEELGVKPEGAYNDLYLKGAFLVSEEKDGNLEKKVDGKVDFEGVKEILSNADHSKIYNAPNQKILLRSLFSKLKEKGIEIRNSSKMSGVEMLNKYMGLRRDYGVFTISNP